MRALLCCGLLPLLVCPAPVSAGEQPVPAKPAAAGSVRADDLLRAARARKHIEEELLAEAVQADIRKARGTSRRDADAARQLRRATMLRVLDSPDISERVRDDLLRKLVVARRKLGRPGSDADGK